VALLTRARRWYRGRIGHVQSPTPKHVENSNRGDTRAKRRGKRGNDLDLQITMADPHCPYFGHPEHSPDGTCRGHIVNTHWLRLLLRDGFRDPLHLIRTRARVDRMTLPEVLRLVAGPRGAEYHVRTIDRAFAHCAEIGEAAVIEPKGDHRFRLDWPWEYMARVADRVGCTVSVRALPVNAAALEPARQAGFKAWEI